MQLDKTSLVFSDFLPKYIKFLKKTTATVPKQCELNFQIALKPIAVTGHGALGYTDTR